MELTKTQEKQVEFLRSCEGFESLSKRQEYHVSCKDCDESQMFFCALSCIEFIYRHKGHYTWVTKLPSQRIEM